MRTNRRQVTGLIHEPKTLPFVTQGSYVFRGVQQLLDSAFRTSRIDWHKAADSAYVDIVALEADNARLRDARDDADAETARTEDLLGLAQQEREKAQAEAETLRAEAKQLRGTLGLAAKYIAKAHADGAYANTAMTGERALRIIGEALAANTSQDAR